MNMQCPLTGNECLEENCAWFLPDKFDAMCSLLHIAEALKKMKDEGLKVVTYNPPGRPW